MSETEVPDVSHAFYFKIFFTLLSANKLNTKYPHFEG